MAEPGGYQESGQMLAGQGRAPLLGALGAGAAAAAKPRGWALQEEAGILKESSAHLLCLAQGHYSLRRERFLL